MKPRRVWLPVLLLLGATAAARAQIPDVNQTKQKLEAIRLERERLEAQQQKLRGQINEAGAELRNIERQREATNRLVNIIEQQMGGLGSELERSGAELALAQDNLVERKAVLNRRLADIYKRGPLQTAEVLLAAESFGDLVARYKYLYLTSRQDKALVDDVQRLTSRIRGQHETIVGLRNELDRKRLDREAEMEHYASLADEKSADLRAKESTSTKNNAKLTAFERDAATLTDLLKSLTAAAARPGAAPVAGRMTTADLGKLDWPVDGEIIFQFGPDTLPTGGVVLNNGIGIAAPVGTPVKVIGSGTVARVATLGTYGLSVIVQHGDTHYSLYTQLQRTLVVAGQKVEKGTVIGTVGGANSGKGPHLYFEIREVRGATQIALDPTNWLRSRRIP